MQYRSGKTLQVRIEQFAGQVVTDLAAAMAGDDDQPWQSSAFTGRWQRVARSIE